MPRAVSLFILSCPSATTTAAPPTPLSLFPSPSRPVLGRFSSLCVTFTLIFVPALCSSCCKSFSCICLTLICLSGSRCKSHGNSSKTPAVLSHSHVRGSRLDPTFKATHLICSALKGIILKSLFFFFLTIHRFITKRTAPLPLTQHTSLAWYRTT